MACALTTHAAPCALTHDAGRTRISLSRSGELFTHVPPHAKVHNIVLGGTWVDAFGEFYVHCPTSGATCRLNFEAAGWFSSGRFQFSGTIEDAEGNAHMLLSGEWNSHCDVQPCGADGEPVPDSEPRRLWSCAPKPEGDKYCFTHFAHGLNGVDGLREAPLASDSRRRADRAALALGDSVAAQQAKHELEEAQRAERRRREAAGDVWTPRYFAPVESLELLPGELGTDVVPAWQWNGAWKGQAAGSTSQPPQPGACVCMCGTQQRSASVARACTCSARSLGGTVHNGMALAAAHCWALTDPPPLAAAPPWQRMCCPRASIPSSTATQLEHAAQQERSEFRRSALWCDKPTDLGVPELTRQV